MAQDDKKKMVRQKQILGFDISKKGDQRCFIDLAIAGARVGRVTFTLYSHLTPRTANNFVHLCKGDMGFGRYTGLPLTYRGTLIHRVINEFCIQGGDFERGDGTGGESIYPENPMGKFGDEPNGLQLRHMRKGLLTMSNSARNANGSQFIITMKAIPVMDGKHVVFGHVESGLVRLAEGGGCKHYRLRRV